MSVPRFIEPPSYTMPADDACRGCNDDPDCDATCDGECCPGCTTPTCSCRRRSCDECCPDFDVED